MDIEALADAIEAQDRRALARAITIVESTRPDHREQAGALLRLLAKPRDQALRVGLSGTPGVGKSTFIEAFGMMLIEQGRRVAVLAIDPSSKRSGGSILGDKTRMSLLSRAPGAFIRPSPAGTQLGGLARNTRETADMIEAAGYDVILIETVGVGQSETVVAELSDLFVLLMAPAGGDELQGVKRGIMEMADILLVNKADGDLRPAAIRTCADYAGALRLLRKRPYDPEGFPKALTVSANEGIGLQEAWQEMQTLTAWRKENGFFAARRQEQLRYWVEEELRQSLLGALNTPEMRHKIEQGSEAVVAGDLTVSQAASALFCDVVRRLDQTKHTTQAAERT